MRFISTLNNGKCFILRDLFILNYWPIIKTLKKLIVICGRNIKYSKLFEYWTRSTFTFNVWLKPWIRVTTQKIATCCFFLHGLFHNHQIAMLVCLSPTSKIEEDFFFLSPQWNACVAISCSGLLRFIKHRSFSYHAIITRTGAYFPPHL